MATTPQHARRVLDLDETATLEDVRRARRKMSFKYHPDRSDDYETSTLHMARINAAADVLMTYLKKYGNPGKKTPLYQDFSPSRRPKSASDSSANANQKPAFEEAKQRFTEHPVRPKPAKVVRPEQPTPNPQAFGEDVLAAKRAATAYSDASKLIGRARSRRLVDTRVLKFTAAR